MECEAWRQQYHALWAPITCARAGAWRGSCFYSSTLEQRITHLSLVLRHVGDCSGALVEKVGGCLLGKPWGRFGWYYTKCKAAWGECVIQHRATDVRPTKPRSLLAAFRCELLLRLFLPQATHRIATQLLPASLSSSSAAAVPSNPHPRTHTLFHPRLRN